MEVSAVEATCKVTVTDRGLDSCQLFTTLNKYHLTDLGLLYLTDKYLDIKTRFSLKNYLPLWCVLLSYCTS